MYVLVIVMPEQLDGTDTVRRFASRIRQPLWEILANHGDCLAWRMTDANGNWADGTENAEKWVQHPFGAAQLVY